METTPSKEAVLEMINVSIADSSRSEAPMITNVHWQVNRGDFWIVAGLQGSGKSTLLETAAGLHPYQEGDLRLFGMRVTGGDGAEFSATRRRVGLVFEGGGRLFQRLTVAENIALPLRYHRNCELEDCAESVLQLITGLGLEKITDVSATRLGRGWSQRIALARALALKPELLLLDNPLAGADSVHLRWWKSILPALLSGNAIAGLPPIALVIAADTFQPWTDLGHQFAISHEGRWSVLGDRSALLASTSPSVLQLFGDNELQS